MRFRFPTMLAPIGAAAVLAAGCGGDDSDDAGSAAPAGGRDAPSAVTIDIADFEYDPPSVEVASGAKVTWTNSDVATHTATSEEGAPGNFNTGIIDQGKSAAAKLDAPGEYAYICTLHPTMKATVTVVGE